jgi:hypothetical protein
MGFATPRLVLASAAPVTHLEFAMNIELDEVVVLDVSDDALEQAAGGAQGGLAPGSFSHAAICC